MLPLDRIAAGVSLESDPQVIEQQLSAIRPQLVEIARSRLSEQQKREVQSDVERNLSRFRRRMMTSEQLSKLEAKFTEDALLASAGLPRLNLYPP